MKYNKKIIKKRNNKNKFPIKIQIYYINKLKT